MAKRKTLPKLVDDLEKAERELSRAFRKWEKARARYKRAADKADKQWGAGEAHVAELAEARLGARISPNERL